MSCHAHIYTPLHTPHRTHMTSNHELEPYPMHDVNIDECEEDEISSRSRGSNSNNHTSDRNDINSHPRSPPLPQNRAPHRYRAVAQPTHASHMIDPYASVTPHRRNGTLPPTDVAFRRLSDKPTEAPPQPSSASTEAAAAAAQLPHSDTIDNPNRTSASLSTIRSSAGARLFYIVPQSLSPALEKGDLVALRVSHTSTRESAQTKRASPHTRTSALHVEESVHTRTPPSQDKMRPSHASAAVTNTKESKVTDMPSPSASITSVPHDMMLAGGSGRNPFSSIPAVAATPPSPSAAATTESVAAATPQTEKTRVSQTVRPMPVRPLTRTQAVRHYLRTRTPSPRTRVSVSTPTPTPSLSTPTVRPASILPAIAHSSAHKVNRTPPAGCTPPPGHTPPPTTKATPTSTALHTTAAAAATAEAKTATPTTTHTMKKTASVQSQQPPKADVLAETIHTLPHTEIISPEGDDIIVLSRVSKPRCDTDCLSPALSVPEPIHHHHYCGCCCGGCASHSFSHTTHPHRVQPSRSMKHRTVGGSHMSNSNNGNGSSYSATAPHRAELSYPSFAAIQRSYNRLCALQESGPLFTYCSTLHRRSEAFYHPRDARYTRIDAVYNAGQPPTTVVATTHERGRRRSLSHAHLAAYFGTPSSSHE